MQKIITIDGPCGVGKSTIAKLFSKQIQFHHFDTGLVYRTLTYQMIKNQIKPSEKEKIKEALKTITLKINQETILLNQAEISLHQLKTSQINKEVAFYAQNSDIRKFTRKMQLAIAQEKNVVVDGRDIGTIVFPNAFCKFYLEAPLQTRAKRRFDESKEKHQKTINEIKAEIKTRDLEDSNRKESPLKIPSNAFIIETSKKKIDDILEMMLNYYKKQFEAQEVMEKSEKENSKVFMNAIESLEDDTIEKGSLQKAKVVSINGETNGEANGEIILNIKSKKDAIIQQEEVSRLDSATLKVGLEIEVIVKKINKTNIIVSYLELQNKETLVEIKKYFEDNLAIEGEITKDVKGGLLVNLKGCNSFCPQSEIDVYKVNKKEFINTKAKFKILSLEGSKIVLSRKKYLEEIYLEARKIFYAQTKVNDIKEVTVIKIIDYGSIVEFEKGINGILKIKNCAWERIEDLSSFFKEGDKIKVKIIKLKEETNKIEVSKKDAEENPFIDFVNTKKEGDLIDGEVKNMEPYGIFIKVAYGVEGFCHISELSWEKKIKHPKEIINIGDKIKTKILILDKENKKLSLGHKQVTKDPWEDVEDKYQINTLIKTKITNITQRGVYCEMTPYAGFIDKDDLSWANKKINYKKDFPINSEIEATIIGFDTKRKKIKLSIKEKTKNPWEDLITNFNKGHTNITAKVIKIIDIGCIVKINENLEGFCHISELSEKFIKKVDDCVNLNESYSFNIQKIDEKNKKIQLSKKEISNTNSNSNSNSNTHHKKEKKKVNNPYLNSSNKTKKITFGDLITK